MRRLVFVQAFSIVILVLATVALAWRVTAISSTNAAERKAKNQASVVSCYRQQAAAPLQRGILIAISDVMDNASIATRQIIRARPGDPANAARRRSIARYQAGKARLADYIATLQARTPTREECRDLAKRLGVK
jgi:hypothetical protein